MGDWFALVRVGNAFSGPYRRVSKLRRPLLRLLLLLLRKLITKGLM